MGEIEILENFSKNIGKYRTERAKFFPSFSDFSILFWILFFMFLALLDTF